MHFSLSSINKNQNNISKTPSTKQKLFADIPESVDAALNLLFGSSNGKINEDSIIQADEPTNITTEQESTLHQEQPLKKNRHLQAVTNTAPQPAYIPSDPGILKFAHYLKNY